MNYLLRTRADYGECKGEEDGPDYCPAVPRGEPMDNTKEALIKLGSENPDLQKDLKPVIDFLNKQAGSKIFGDAWRDSDNDIAILLKRSWKTSVSFPVMKEAIADMEHLAEDLENKMTSSLGARKKISPIRNVSGHGTLDLRFQTHFKLSKDSLSDNMFLNQMIEEIFRDLKIVPRSIKIRG